VKPMFTILRQTVEDREVHEQLMGKGVYWDVYKILEDTITYRRWRRDGFFLNTCCTRAICKRS
jgi:hypothetical protein